MGKDFYEERKNRDKNETVNTTEVLSSHSCGIPHVELELKYLQKKVLKEITFQFPLSSFGSGQQRQS